MGLDMLVTLLSPDSVINWSFNLLGPRAPDLPPAVPRVQRQGLILPPCLAALPVTKPGWAEKFGAWAVVMGAAQELGESTLWLRPGTASTSSGQQKQAELENVANEIRTRTRWTPRLSWPFLSDADNIGKIVKKVKALNHEIGVVVNNVGMMGPELQQHGRPWRRRLSRNHHSERNGP